MTKAYYNKSTNQVVNNPCFLCIPGKFFDNKETEYVKEAIKQINSKVDEKLSQSYVQFFNFISLNYIVSKTRNNVPIGIEKAKEIIPGTIIKLLNYATCIFFIYMVPATGASLLLYFNIIQNKLQVYEKGIIMGCIYLFFLILTGVTTVKYGKSRINNYIKQVTDVVKPI